MPRANSGVSAVVLAGGRATRMGGKDKGLLVFRGKPLAAQICAALAPQVTELMINANRNFASYKKLNYKVIRDQLADYQGPLAGMARRVVSSHASVATDYSVRRSFCMRRLRQPNVGGRR